MTYETEKWREPEYNDSDMVIFSEHGRILDNVCYRSHWISLVKQFNFYYLVVKHGAGQERILIGYSQRLVSSLAALDSDSRYYLLYTLLSVHKKAALNAADNTALIYQSAFIDGSLKKRVNAKRGIVKVWIEDKHQSSMN